MSPAVSATLPPRRLVTACLAALVFTLPSWTTAHDIPNDITIYSFVKPEGQQLRLLARVPLTALLDVDWPRRGPDLLDLKRADSLLADAATLWLADNITVFEGERALAYPRVERARVSQFSDRSFESYERALASLTGPRLEDGVDVSIRGAFLDVLFDYAINSEGSRFSVEPRFGRLGIRTGTVLRLVRPDGSVRAFDMEGNPGLVRLDPAWYQAAAQFLKLGFYHILDGINHLLFLVCLVIPFRRLGALVQVATAFTLAHSITLIATGFDVIPDALWFPPFIETLMAASILYVALDNIVGANLRRRWIIAFGFGLVHGLGFSFPLRQTLQFAGSHLLASRLSFNVGIELGQLLVLVLLIPSLSILFRFVVAERLGTIVLSALVAHTGWHWMIERGRQLSRYQFSWPELTPAFLASGLRWMMVVVAVAGAVWLVRLILKARDVTGPFQSWRP